MMTLCLIYAFHLLLCKPLKRTNSPLFVALVKGPFCWRASIFPLDKIHHSQEIIFSTSMSNQESVETADSLVDVAGRIRGKMSVKID